MEINFFIVIPSEEIGEKISTEVKRLGYKVSVEQDNDTREWTCYCTNTMIPFYDDIIKIEEGLNNIASQYGGYTDGLVPLVMFD
jgi:PhoPQ-activated pathogenicity-related protein